MIAGTFIRSLPLWVTLSVAAAYSGILYLYAWTDGASGVQEKWDAERQERVVRVLTIQRDVAQEVVKYKDRVRVVEREADAVIREVPVYVQNQCTVDGRIPAGFRWVHDAAARGTGASPDRRGTDDPSAPTEEATRR